MSEVRRVSYVVQLRGEFSLTAEDMESLERAMHDMVEAARHIPFFTGLKFSGATSENVSIAHEIVSDDCYASLRTGDYEVEAA